MITTTNPESFPTPERGLTKEKKHVTFAPVVSTVVALVEKRKEIENENLIWYSDEERSEIRKGALEYAKELRQNYLSLVKGMECIYRWADLASREEGSHQQQKHDFLDKWASLGSDRRGLEKKILRKEYQAARTKSVEGTRKLVLTLQDMLGKEASANGVRREETISRQYEELSRPYRIFAQTLALTDQEAVKSYYKGESKRRVKKASSVGSLRTLDSDDDATTALKTWRSKTKKASSLRGLSTGDDLAGDSTHSKARRTKKKPSSKKRRSLSPKKISTNREGGMPENVLFVAPAC